MNKVLVEATMAAYTRQKKVILSVLLILCYVLGLSIQGALPGFSLTTLGQAVAVVGYSVSFINEGGGILYATNMGFPSSAAMSTMLAPALVMEVFLLLGQTPADAFNFAFIAWYTIGFYGAFSLSRSLGVSSNNSCLLALLWMSFPIVWASSGYSHLHFGLVLLPFLFYSSMRITLNLDDARGKFLPAFLLLLSSVLAIFTDGYTFMFFAVGSFLFAASVYLKDSEARARLLFYVAPLHAVSFLFAYLMFAFYIGKSGFGGANLDFFRGWGVDLSFLIVPSKGVHWVWDYFGFSVARSGRDYFGDSSVWVSTFFIPVLLVGVVLLWKSRSFAVSRAFAVVAIFGLYMAMGPSVKINATKPVETGSMMQAQYAGPPTGSAVLSKHVPGFKSMRASYRWIALGFFGVWGLILAYGATRPDRAKWVGAILVVLIIGFVPNMFTHLEGKRGNYDSFARIDSDLLGSLRDNLKPGEIVAFLPWQNDFLANYLAPMLDVKSYNIGGDKNLAEARTHWPDTMRQFKMAAVDDGFADRVVLLLAKREADAVILPYIDMLWAAHQWPYPVQFREQLAPAVTQLASSGFVEIEDREFYAAVRLKPHYLRLAQQGTLEPVVRVRQCMPPVCLKRSGFGENTPSRVGTVQDARLVSDGRAGFIHFGPYVPMSAGRYKLVVRGEGEVTSSAWVDVVSRKGSVQHGRFPLTRTANEDGVIADEVVDIDEPAEDIEVRVYVGEEDEVVLEGYELIRIKSGSQQGQE